MKIVAMLIIFRKVAKTVPRDSNIPILSITGKSYGSNSTEFSQQGKSKFYSVKEEEEEGLPGENREGKSKFYRLSEEGEEELPEESREGKSRFYRQEALEVKSPEKDGFQEIFTSKEE